MSEKKDVQTLWEDVRDWLADATRTAIQEAEDLSRRGRLKVELMNLNRRIERKLAELGGVVYARLGAEPEAALEPDERIRSIVDSVRELEAERSRKQALYEAEKQKKR